MDRIEFVRGCLTCCIAARQLESLGNAAGSLACGIHERVSGNASRTKLKRITESKSINSLAAIVHHNQTVRVFTESAEWDLAQQSRLDWFTNLHNNRNENLRRLLLGFPSSCSALASFSEIAAGIAFDHACGLSLKQAEAYLENNDRHRAVFQCSGILNGYFLMIGRTPRIIRHASDLKANEDSTIVGVEWCEDLCNSVQQILGELHLHHLVTAVASESRAAMMRLIGSDVECQSMIDDAGMVAGIGFENHGIRFTSSGMRANRSPRADDSLKSDPNAITPFQFTLLNAMWELGAVSSETRKTYDEIAAKAIDEYASGDNIKKPMRNLKKRGMTEAKQGNGGGSWLTEKGKAKVSQR